ncbi:hypothetical protein [Streptomyces sp. NRRL S-920]|uniref:hypothetical protein n=1 Tax=Streptomyces sp. NRRL S-920 TaxID=1463921 RepID=UPI001F36AE82|nr:hypothetical protein [Streptomyces sp. NRRL S-920]
MDGGVEGVGAAEVVAYLAVRQVRAVSKIEQLRPSPVMLVRNRLVSRQREGGIWPSSVSSRPPSVWSPPWSHSVLQSVCSGFFVISPEYAASPSSARRRPSVTAAA